MKKPLCKWREELDVKQFLLKGKLLLFVKQFPPLFKQVDKELELQTKLCKFCFGSLEKRHFIDVFNSTKSLCHRCSNNIQYRHTFKRVWGKLIYIPYRYESNFKRMIHQFKSAKDIELGIVFVDPLLPWIHLWFQVDGLILVPSARLHIQERGFHHLIVLFEGLKKPIYDCFLKTHTFKQAEQTFNERQKIYQYIIWNPLFDTMDRKKSYLLVDDVFTTGNTMQTLVKILVNKGFNRIRLFAFAATEIRDKD
jgi:competence protein ComFC